MVWHTDLDDPITRCFRADQQLRRNERRPRLELRHHRIDHVPAEQLESAIDVVQAQTEGASQDDVVHACDRDPMPGIGTLDPPAGDDVGVPELPEEQSKIGNAELPVTVDPCDGIAAAVCESGPHGVSVAEVRRMRHEAHLRPPLGVRANDLRSPVLRAVVDDDDLELVREAPERIERLGEKRPDVVFFVEDGENRAEQRNDDQPPRRWRLRFASAWDGGAPYGKRSARGQRHCAPVCSWDVLPRTSARDALRRLARWSATPAGLGALFVFGLAIRLVLARGGGFPYDMDSFAGWAQRLAERGPWHFYPRGSEQFFVDYPPGYLYVLWGLGSLARAIGSGAPGVFWLKLPPVFGDLGLAWIVMRAAERLTPAGIVRRFPVRGLAAAAILLNPAVFFVSAVWGQVDVFGAVLIGGALLLLGTGLPTFRREAAGLALVAIAIGTKPQAALVVPVVVLLLVWRHVRSRVVGAHDKRRATLFGIGRIASSSAVGVVAGLLLVAPFHLGPVGAVHFYEKAARTYPVTSVFAFNLWGAVSFWRGDSGPKGLHVLGLPVAVWGLILFCATAALVLVWSWRALQRGEDEGRVLVFGSVAITLAGFAVLTRIHERYLFLPLALLAMLVGIRWMRRAFVVLSALYFVNVYFPYVFYLRFKGRPAPSLGGFFDAFYGSVGGVQLKALSVIATLACGFIAWRGWASLQAPVEIETPSLEERVVDEPARVQPERWTMHLHPIGRRGALIALAVFAVAFFSRVAGLGHPPGMYFDEVYHARTGAEYIAHKEVYEWTHPPLAKELIALSIAHLSNFGVHGRGTLPPGMLPGTLTGTDDGLLWAEGNGPHSGRLRQGALDSSCSPVARGDPISVDLRPDVIAASGESVFVAGVGPEGPLIARFDGHTERWGTTLPDRARQVVVVAERAYVVTRTGELVSVSPTGETNSVAVGAPVVSAAATGDRVWVSFPTQGRIAAWGSDGNRASVVEVSPEPSAIVVPALADLAYVSAGDRLVSIDTKEPAEKDHIEGGANMVATVPETGIVWAAQGRELRAIEPRAAAAIGRVSLQRTPEALVGDPSRHALLAINGRHIECASGRPQFAWRLGSAVFGALMVLFVFLISMRLFGSVVAGLLGALFLTIDGLAFTLSRIAMNDSYMTAFILAAWFCLLSGFYRWGRAQADDPEFARVSRSRGAAATWLVAAGVSGGLGLSSKWPALYGLVGIGMLIVWDGFSRGPDSLFRIFGGVGRSAAFLIVVFGVVPLALYVTSYIPYFSLGHTFDQFLQLQKSMYEYHANLTATHPFGSPWYGWPLGHKAVYLYLSGDSATTRSEIWTLPNLVVFGGGLWAMAVAAVRARRLRSAALALVAGAAAIQYLPFVPVRRVLFLYHYLPVVPFLCIALGWWLVIGLRGSRYRHAIAAAVTAAAVVLFLLSLPMLEGWSVSTAYLDGMRNAFPWILP
jgi:dolichyl-phosphate-mannose-protein mannosyltransferase